MDTAAPDPTSPRTDTTSGAAPLQPTPGEVLAAVPDIVVAVDTAGRIVLVNDAAERILGVRPAEWIGRNVFDVLHRDDVGISAEAMVSSIETGPGTKEPLVVRVRGHGGRWVPVEIVAQHVGGAGQVELAVISARDVGSRHDAAASAEGVSNRFARAFDRAPIGMALVASDGHFLRANEALASMTGRTVLELTGSSILDLVDPSERERAEEFAVRVLDDHDDPGEFRFLRPDGSSAWARASCTVLRDDAGDLEHVLVHLEDVTEQRRLREELVRAAMHDPLTGLLNRAGFEHRYTQAVQRSRGSSALVLIDLDGFKGANDRFGHAAGDAVLVEVARRLRDVVRPEDPVGRLGGDEFALHVSRVQDPAEAVAVAERVRGALAVPIEVDKGVAGVTGSVGVAFLEWATNLDRALASADAVAYRVKRAGGNDVGLTWCSPGGGAEP